LAPVRGCGRQTSATRFRSAASPVGIGDHTALRKALVAGWSKRERVRVSEQDPALQPRPTSCLAGD
jgi:hypothetical protein